MSLPLPLVVLFALASLSAALPLTRTSESNVAFEPLYRHATTDVGPRRSLERLRLRRNALALAQPGLRAKSPTSSPVTNSKIFDDASVYIPPVTNPKLAARSLAAPVTNPKKRDLDAVLAKRAQLPVSTNFITPRSLAVPTVIANPKARRAVPEPKSPAPVAVRRSKRPRNFLSFFANIANARRTAPPAPSTRVVANPKARRSLNARANIVSSLPKFQVGVQVVIPNPKSTNFGAVVAGISSMLGSATSTTASSSSSAMSTSPAPSTSMAASSSAVATSSSRSSVRSSSSSSSVRPSSTTVSSTAASATPKTASWPTGSMISAAYYPDWDGDLLPPSAVDFSLFDLIDFAFAVPTADYSVEFTQYNSGALLTELVKFAHGNNTKVLISVGGWTASTYFSSAVSTTSNRNKFVKNLVAMMNQYGVDGIDIDWEYPGGGGDSGNQESTSDTANYLLFLTALRAAVGPNKRITTCVTQSAFLGADGSPLADVSAFANVLDNILVMNYDVWGASSTPGPNAPLSNACPNSNQPNANELSSIKAWTAAGMPASKILMGVPSYGYISSSTATTLVHRRDNVNNRERASLAHAESQKSRMHRSFDRGQSTRAKRDTIIVCPNNHSGKPCNGIVNQTITTINWNPLNKTAGSTNSTGGVFGGGVGVGKLGNGNLAAIDGNQIQFYQLLSYGVIVEQDTSGNYTGTNGYTRVWDQCSSTPYLYDVSRKVVITYDDPASLTLKAQMAKAQKIGGVNMWDISGDTDSWSLVKAFRAGMGLA